MICGGLLTKLLTRVPASLHPNGTPVADKVSICVAWGERNGFGMNGERGRNRPFTLLIKSSDVSSLICLIRAISPLSVLNNPTEETHETD